MDEPIGIDFYRDFWDFPRIFVVHYQGLQLLFDCVFDETTGDYWGEFSVYVLPNIEDDKLCFPNSWKDLALSAQDFLGKVEVGNVRFDETRKKVLKRP